MLGLADRLRPGASDAVREVAAVTGSSPVLLTGLAHGHPEVGGGHGGGIVDPVANQEHSVTAGFDRFDGGNFVLGEEPGADVGDPDLIGQAGGGGEVVSGSDLALETADAVIVRDDLGTIPTLISISISGGPAA